MSGDPPAPRARAPELPEDRLSHRPLRAAKLPHRVASAIVEEVVGRDLGPGDWLPSETELAARFGVSRGSIREALRVLETFGVVRIKPGKNGGNEVGAVDAEALARILGLVFRVARATYRDLMDARLVIEPVMARQAAERRDPARLEELRALLARDAASTAGTPEGDGPALAFHWLICGASGNPVMDALGQAVHALYGNRLAADLLSDPGCRTTAARHVHDDIGRAILDGDGRRAQELMAEHMEDVRALQEERTPRLLDELVAWAP